MKLLARAWPHSLVGRLIVVSAGFFVLVCLVGWWALASAIRAPAAEAVDNRMITLGQELRGYWATATIVGQSPQGPADLEWHWQIQVDDGPVYSSEQLSSEDILLPVGTGAATDVFGFQQIESDLGTLWMVQRRIAETPPAPPGLDTPAPQPVMVTYSVALTTGYRRELIGEQIAPLQRAGRNVLAVFAGLIALLLISLGLLVQRPLGRLTQAAQRFQSGDSARLDGAYPSEINAVVSSLNDIIGQNDRLVERTRRYIGKIAHDLKHPLAIVRNALDNPEDHEIAKRRLDGMVGTLNRYSSLASAIGPGGPHAPFRLRQVLEDARDGFALLYRKTPLTIEVDCPPDLAVRMARQDLEALITNLVANAHQHAGGLVRLSAFQQGQGAMIVVEDDGPGLDEADCERALSWGVRLDTAPPGSGFGLAIVQDLAQLYAGEVSLDRSELNGLRAKIYLPEVQAFTIA